jgi:hypothetical protein
MSTPVSERRFEDASLEKTIALPNAATTVNTASVDLGKASPFPLTEKLHVKLSTDAATGGTDGKTVVVTIHDSADDSSFAAIDGVGTLTLVSASTAYAAGSMTFALPPGTRRYIRATATGETSGGDASDGNLGMKILF